MAAFRLVVESLVLPQIDPLPEDTAARADATFVVHATCAPMRTPGMLARVAPDLVLADSGLPCDTFNIVCRARLAGPDGMQRCRDAVGYFHGARRPFSWWVGPADEPASLGAMLESVGLERTETELAMALRLDDLPDRHPEVPGLEVRRVRTTAQLESWANVTASNWTPPDPGGCHSTGGPRRRVYRRLGFATFGNITEKGGSP